MHIFLVSVFKWLSTSRYCKYMRDLGKKDFGWSLCIFFSFLFLNDSYTRGHAEMEKLV